MNDSVKIPCTVAILTKNSAGTLARALQSVSNFAEIIICDGGSTDATLDIARQYGARVITQDSSFLDVSGRIIDFSGVRNQTLSAATQQWFFYLDSDERLTPDLVREIRDIVSRHEPCAWWIDRKYELDGEVVECAATYPTRQVRLFHRAVVHGFIKTIHERIDVSRGASVHISHAYMVVPVSSDPGVWRTKWTHYIALEVARRARISFSDWLLVCAENLKVSALYLFRYGRNLVFCSGKRMPWALEWERHVYHWRLCAALWGVVV